jgi:hypothetical protein
VVGNHTEHIQARLILILQNVSHVYQY